jgi:prepilin-type N-terminal cleavage/methylation domain-containing protein
MLNTNQNKFSMISRASGFTLIEVLATVVLIAIIMPVAMKGISLATKVAGQSKQRVEAASLARTKLTEIIATDEWEYGNVSGDFGEDWPEYNWTFETSDWSDASLRQLDMVVSWGPETEYGQQYVTLTTLVYAE